MNRTNKGEKINQSSGAGQIPLAKQRKTGHEKILNLACPSAGSLHAACVPQTAQVEGCLEAKRHSGRYMPGLDGLRALAVLAVIAYHFNLQWAPGGLLGVCLFFVLSGYLITDLLAAQWSVAGHIDLKGFWLRRARRLLPALIVMLGGVAVWTAVSAPSRLAPLGEDTLAALLYSSNWWFIFHQVSYFTSIGPPSPLGHLWSLAVEEQFYLVWPLLLWAGLYYIPRRGRLVGLILAGVFASAIAMALIYQPGTDPSRVYYGTDTRAFALLVGAALALAWPSQMLSDTLSPKARLALDAVGGISLVLVLLMIWQTNKYETFLYRGGLLFFSLAAAVLVAVLVHPASRLGKLFGLPPLRWLGVRSYGIYLWHYPVIVLTSPAVNTGGVNIGLIISQLMMCIALAALSWRLIEEPIRYGTWTLWGGSPSPEKEQDHGRVRGWATLVSVLLLLGVSCLALFFILKEKTPNLSSAFSGPTQTTGVQAGSKAGAASGSAGEPSNPASEGNLPPAPPSDAQAKTQVGEQPANNAGTLPGAGLSSGSPAEGSPKEGSTKEGSPEEGSPKEAAGTTSPLTPEAGQGVTAIGDSVMVGAEPALQKLLPGIVVDAQVGRQLYQAQAVAAQLKAKGNLGERVVIELGTNGPFTKEQLTALLDSLGKVKQIVLVNTRVPRTWEGVVNQTLSQVAGTYPNTTLVDWYAASGGHNAYFAQDGVHLTQEGIQAYADLVAKALDVKAS